MSSAVLLGAPPRTAPSTPRRADIDGLRVLAITLVVGYHVWFDRVSGGVDVFLLLSAYLLTDSLVRRAEAGERSALVAGWVRRFARLLPPAAVTILGVLVFVALVLPESAWAALWSQAWSSLLYLQNWDLAFASVDYYARAEEVPTPLLHFWSLSIQGQVFVLWPLLIVAGLALARRISRPPRVVLLWVFGGVFVLSLMYSVVTTAESQQFAYFDTVARLWEFALGSLAALVAPRIRPTAAVGAVLAWVGFVGLVVCGIVLDVPAGFPGIAALWPTLCAVAILWAGQAAAPSAPTRLLSSRVLSGVGPFAYCLYLVHWPILIGFLVLTDSPRAGIPGGLTVIALSVVAAVVLHLVVERPSSRRASGARPGRTILVAALVVAVPLAAWQVSERLRGLVVDAVANPGAAVLVPGAEVRVPRGAPLAPRASLIEDEWVRVGEPCRDEVRPVDAAARENCVERRSSTEGAPTILVLGNSHAQQWSGAILPGASEDDWNIVGVYRGGCALTPADLSEDDVDCRAWQDAAFRFAQDFPADVVVVMGTRSAPDSPDERVPTGIDDYLDLITGSGSDAVLLRDNPRFADDVFQCVESAPGDTSVCDRARSDVLAPANPAAHLAERDGVHVVDLTDYLCPDAVCRAVIGNVAVYMDDNHLTGTYAATLGPMMHDALRQIPRLRPAPA